MLATLRDLKMSGGENKIQGNQKRKTKGSKT